MKTSVILLLSLMMIGCNKPAGIKTNNNVDESVLFYDFFNQRSVDQKHDLSVLRLYVSRKNQFENRFEQIQFALDISPYDLSLKLSDYDLDSLKPSVFLNVNRLMSLDEYLRLAGFNDHVLVIDPVNQIIAYIKEGSVRHKSILFPGQLAEPAINDEAPVSEEPIIEVHPTSEPPIINDSIEFEAKEDEAIAEALVVDESTPVQVETSPIDLSDDHFEVLEADEIVDIEMAESPVEQVVGIDAAINIDSNLTLLEIFTHLADSQEMSFVNSMGINSWFLNSTINHSFEFENLDHALMLLLSESNRILETNNIPFTLMASKANSILEVYYE